MIIIETFAQGCQPRYQPSTTGSIPHDSEHWIATAQGRSRLPPVLNRLRIRSPKCAVPPAKQASNNRPQRPSRPSNRATLAHHARLCSRPDALRSFAHSQIPIAGCAAPPRTIARGFVPWRLSDAGHRAPGSVVHGRHPKPCTRGDIHASWASGGGTAVNQPARIFAERGSAEPVARMGRAWYTYQIPRCKHRSNRAIYPVCHSMWLETRPYREERALCGQKLLVKFLARSISGFRPTNVLVATRLRVDPTSFACVARAKMQH
jgi:hypothetical protein